MRKKKKINYKNYLRSKKWKMKRISVLKRAKYRCQLCNNKNRLQVHHRTYKNIGKELLTDLTVLCFGCHNLFHKYRKLCR